MTFSNLFSHLTFFRGSYVLSLGLSHYDFRGTQTLRMEFNWVQNNLIVEPWHGLNPRSRWTIAIRAALTLGQLKEWWCFQFYECFLFFRKRMLKSRVAIIFSCEMKTFFPAELRPLLSYRRVTWRFIEIWSTILVRN